jgi:hypothetical protein
MAMPKIVFSSEPLEAKNTYSKLPYIYNNQFFTIKIGNFEKLFMHHITVFSILWHILTKSPLKMLQFIEIILNVSVRITSNKKRDTARTM